MSSTKSGPNHPTLNKKDSRTRLYSWSRPSREMRSKGFQFDSTEFQQCICGTAHLAFHPTMDWFQGNIVSASGDSYEINGTKCRQCSSSSSSSSSSYAGSPRYGKNYTGDAYELPQQSQAGPAGQTSQRDSNRRTSCSSTASPNSIDEEESSCGSLSSSLVQSAMERLNLEELDSAACSYNVYIKDYETGLEHNIKDVAYSMEEDTLRLESNNLQFSSSSMLKGTRADVAIAKNLTPQLVHMGLTAFVGDLKMTYVDEPCFPVTPDASQWCL